MTVEKVLTDRGKTFVRLSINERLTRLIVTLKINEESTNGLWQVLQKTSHKPGCDNL
jgi:hypothetical protein